MLIVAYFIPYTQSWGEKAAIWFDVLAAIAFILGGGNLLKTHLKKISDRVARLGLLGHRPRVVSDYAGVGLGKIGVGPSPQFPAFHVVRRRTGRLGSPFWFCYQYAFTPLTATIFAMLAFYVASAAFRAFRAKNLEASCCSARRSSSCLAGRSPASRSPAGLIRRCGEASATSPGFGPRTSRSTS